MDLHRFTAAWQTYEREPLRLTEADFQVLAAFDPPLEQQARSRQRQAQLDLIAAKSAPALGTKAASSSKRSPMDTQQLAAVVSSTMDTVLTPVLERIAKLEAAVSQMQRDTKPTASQ